MILGIDLGTTNSLVGVYEAGFATLIADEEGALLTPSVVHYPETGEPVVGRTASRLRTVAPERTVYSVKRLMGRKAGEENVEDLGYRVVSGQGGALRVSIAGKELLPEEISAQVLAKLKRDAEKSLGVPVDKAVVTVPAYFNDGQRNATKKAGELAGLEVVRILNEPTAAALAYGLDRLEEKGKVAVYDLGGGTFDISILELSGGVFQVLSTNGNTRLGGDDIDNRLADYFAERLGVVDPDLIQKARLLELARDTKHRLSTEEEVLVTVPFLTGGSSGELSCKRSDLERLSAPIIEKTRSHCLRALADARIEASELKEVILVGGSTRMPLVRRFVEEVFGRIPNTSQNPDEAVAIGATLQAGILSGALQNVVLLDITPLSLGIETFGGLMNVIIPRNTTIPYKAGEMFTNALAGQKSMLVRVLQGEREMANDNWELGRFEIPFEPLPKGQARVGVQFEIDANGILAVLARDTLTGVERVVQMASAVDVSDEAVEKMLEDSLENAFEDMNTRVFTEAKLKADEMLPSVRTALSKVGAQLDTAELEEINRCMEAVDRALESGAAQPLKRATLALDEATQRLATLLIQQVMGQSA
ncbi:MAG: Hsp70 family protein [Verrucomicrobiota bacterium]